MRKWTTTLFFLTLLALFPNPIFSQSPNAATSPDTATEARVSLTLVYLNDFHGYDPMRLARMAAAIKTIRQDSPNVILLNAGDAFTRGPYDKLFHGELEFAAFNAMGTDAFTLGNNEFKATGDARAIAFLNQRIRQARFPVLAANVTERNSGRLIGGTKPYVILDRGGLRVAIIGVTSQTPGSKLAEKAYRFSDEIKAAKAVYAQAAEEADIVIALTHIGIMRDQELASRVPGLAAIVGGHSHTLLTEPYVKDGVPIVQAGYSGAFLGTLTLTFKKDGARWARDSFRGSLLSVDDYSADPDTQTLVDGFLREKPKKK
jgi:2',3'-cyclic-nucleotide 2'-phosphodiesterase (5'-nucleotidase family)